MLFRSGEREVTEAIVRSGAQAVIHTAAISDIGDCERDPDASRRANVELTLWVCRAAKALHAKCVCYSSDQVYTGLEGKGPFREEEARNPANVYARHKLEAEKRALDLLPEAVMLRATWMYDHPGPLPLRGNLFMNVLQQVQTGQPARFSTCDLRGVTWAQEAVENTCRALALPGGTYNFGSDGEADMYRTARELAAMLGGDADRLILPDADRTPRSLRMDSTRARQGGVMFSDNLEGLRRCLQDWKKA